jgi:hypothetical protein
VTGREPVLLGVLASVMLVALGTSACGRFQPADAPSARASPTVAVSASWGDDNHQVSLHVGQEIKVDLTGQSCDPTSIPVAASPSILAVEQIGTNHYGAAWARFRALRRGSTVVTAVNAPACGAGQTTEPSEGAFTFHLLVAVT